MDVAIVGGGPAGSYTAYRALMNNPDLEVHIYDKRKEIGNPVNCAGGIVTFWLKRLGMKLPRHLIRARLKGLKIVAPDGTEWVHHQDDLGDDEIIGYVMDRRKFDEWNLERAMKAGAVVHLGENPARWDHPYKFYSKYIIGADGWQSQLGTHFGFKTEVDDQDMHVGVEYRINMPEYDQDYITFYIGHRWAPQGYLWIFPEGNDVVKVGLGIPRSYARTTSLRHYLLNFLADYPEYDQEHLENRASGSGYIPTARPMKQLTTKLSSNQWIGLVGDAARQVDPLHGGGISTAMLAAQLCGQVMADGRRLSLYRTLWDQQWRPEHNRRYAMKETLTGWSDQELNKMIRALQSFSFESSRAPVEAGRMMLHLVKKEPRMFTAGAARMLASYATARF